MEYSSSEWKDFGTHIACRVGGSQEWRNGATIDGRKTTWWSEQPTIDPNTWQSHKVD